MTNKRFSYGSQLLALASLSAALVSPLQAEDNGFGPTQPGDYDRLCTCINPDTGIRQIPVRIRDFKREHADFEAGKKGWDFGIVKKQLGADGRPVYAKTTTPTTSNKENFNQWYRDVPGVNLPISKTLTMDRIGSSAGVEVYRYANSSFFPIDGEGFGNQGFVHNYHFTLETHLKFFYVAGGHFTFDGDDDLWIFINGKLAVDIGGVHGSTKRTVNLDDMADELGIEPGNSYSFDLFYAERHSVNSAFQFETTFELQCL